MPLPGLDSVNGNRTGPATPVTPRWICAALPVMSAVTMVAFMTLVLVSTTTTPVAEAVLILAGTSLVPVRVAE